MTDAQGFQPSGASKKNDRKKKSKERSKVRKAEQVAECQRLLDENSIEQAFWEGKIKAGTLKSNEYAGDFTGKWMEDALQTGIFTKEQSDKIESILNKERLSVVLQSDAYDYATLNGFKCRWITQDRYRSSDDVIVLDMKNRFNDFLILSKEPLWSYLDEEEKKKLLAEIAKNNQ